MSQENNPLLQVKTSGEDDAVCATQDRKTNEYVYCEALAEVLHYIVPPVMVGFYAPWGRNKRGLLGTVEDAMRSRGAEKKNGKGCGRDVISLLSLIWRIVFYLPVYKSIPSNGDQPKEVQYIFISFDAWEYVGCDRTWAGLVMTLLDVIEKKDKILFSVVRAFGGESFKEDKPSGNKWAFKSWTKIFFKSFLGGVIGLALRTVLLRGLAENELWKRVGYTTVLVSAVVSAVPFLAVAKNFLFTMKRKIQKDMKSKDLSAQLGFMHKVKEEVKTTVSFLNFLELKEDRKIRVVLKITSLDFCTPDKVVAVLDAVNVLLCEPDAPFISILVADPSILVECIEQSRNTCKNGYLYLDRIVSLPFSLPPMSREARSQLLDEILKHQLKERSTTNPGKEYHAGSGKVNLQMVIDLVSCCLHKRNSDPYFPGNSVQMRRVVNTLLTMWTMVKMGFQPKGGHKMSEIGKPKAIEEMIDWVVLANCWPCRLSWILQCVEDDEQRRRLEGSQKSTTQDSVENPGGPQQGERSGSNDKLLDIFEANAPELDRMKYSIRKLFELDGDPELFQIFLQKSHFTVRRARYFSDLLINLDFSLKQRFELLRGLNSITRKKKMADLHSLGNTETDNQLQDN
ncbi:NTPase KAP family P-loop domain-containing protein 1-like [Heteronotia binoei]|uniref:NTPase KAP family P-loop domain-containing protein 1-like n=1 Tax=Heteronotia binoei TaxID=13085 RepID=UPI0029319C7B|nr:NTPase KAP family P-loop domain-containing protein 1-like [Heteronotia binoei]